MPNGRADAVQDAVVFPGGDVKTCFVLPLEERMPFKHFAVHLQQQHSLLPSSSHTASTNAIRGDATESASEDTAQPVSSETRLHSTDLAHQSRHHGQGNDSSDVSELTAEYMPLASASADGRQAHSAQPTGSLSSQQQSASQTDPCKECTISSRMPLARAELSSPRAHRQCDVLYLQQQNSNLTNPEFSRLHQDIELEIPWARDVFGASPDACNLWIGNDCSTTSFHKDHYENLFAVVTGEKHFVLLPPCDIYRLYMQEFPVAHIERSAQGDLQTKLAEPKSNVKWTAIDPFSPAPPEIQALYPAYYDTGMPQPFKVVVRPGDLLYLPSLWLHAVAQKPDRESKVIGVNFWYDMRFDQKYAYYKLVESLAEAFTNI